MIPNPWLMIAGGVGVLALSVMSAYGGYRYENSMWTAKWEKHLADDEKITEQFKTDASKRESEYEAAKSKVESDYFAAQKQRDAIIASQHVAASSLRDTIASYSQRDCSAVPQASTGSPSPDGVPNVLGQLLEQCVGLVEQGAANAGRAADTIRSFQAFTLGVTK